jgi:hypothetical protein
MTPPRIAIVACVSAVVLVTGNACSSSVGLQKKPNEWALACESVGRLIKKNANDADRQQATEELGSLLDKYGGDGKGATFETLVGPVVDGAHRDQLGPARKFFEANCGP